MRFKTNNIYMVKIQYGKKKNVNIIMGRYDGPITYEGKEYLKFIAGNTTNSVQTNEIVMSKKLKKDDLLSCSSYFANHSKGNKSKTTRSNFERWLEINHDWNYEKESTK